jgi:hypothetical protein
MLRLYSCSSLRQATQAFSTPCRDRLGQHHSILSGAPWRVGRSPAWQLATRSHFFARSYSNSSPNTDDLPASPKRSGWTFKSLSIFNKSTKSAPSLWKIVSLARPERKPLLLAVGLLLVSSTVSMSIPFTIGKLIDFFSSTTPVRQVLFCERLGIKHNSIANSSGTLGVASFRCSPRAVHDRCLCKCWTCTVDANGRLVP